MSPDPRHLPGIGFVHVEGANEPVRVRFTWITDDQITDMADRWPAPGQQAQVIELSTHDRQSVPDHPDHPDSGLDSESRGA